MFSRLCLFLFCAYLHIYNGFFAHVLCAYGLACVPLFPCDCNCVRLLAWEQLIARQCAISTCVQTDTHAASGFYPLELLGGGLGPCQDERSAQQPRQHRAALLQCLRIVNTNALFRVASLGPHHSMVLREFLQKHHIISFVTVVL